VLRGCHDVVAGLLLTLSCALLLVVLAARLDVAWLLVLGVRAYDAPGPRKLKPYGSPGFWRGSILRLPLASLRLRSLGIFHLQVAFDAPDAYSPAHPAEQQALVPTPSRLRVYYYKCLGSLVGHDSSLVTIGTSDGPDCLDDLLP